MLIAAQGRQKDDNLFRHPYAFVNARPLISADPDGRDAIIIAYPDFKPEIRKGWRPLALGHGGVLIIDNKTGKTKYYEYGRYDPQEKGVTRTVPVPDVVMRNGKPTAESLQRVYSSLSANSGHHGRIRGAYIESDKTEEMKRYAESKIRENSDPQREEYGVFTHNCATFASEVVQTDPNVRHPTVVFDNSPNNMVDEYLDEGYQSVEYVPPTPATGAGTTGAHQGAAPAGPSPSRQTHGGPQPKVVPKSKSSGKRNLQQVH
jgi:hypothetical protein